MVVARWEAVQQVPKLVMNRLREGGQGVLRRRLHASSLLGAQGIGVSSSAGKTRG